MLSTSTSRQSILTFVKWMNAIMYTYKPLMLLAKLSICLMFFQIFGASLRMRYAIYFAIFYNVTLQACAFFFAIFLCTPGRPEFWTCSKKISSLNITTSGLNIFADLYLLALPFFALSKLQLEGRRKIGLLAIFMAGVVYEGALQHDLLEADLDLGPVYRVF